MLAAFFVRGGRLPRLLRIECSLNKRVAMIRSQQMKLGTSQILWLSLAVIKGKLFTVTLLLLVCDFLSFS